MNIFVDVCAYTNDTNLRDNYFMFVKNCLFRVKPYWKRCVYSGSSATRHKRTIFSNMPLNMEWVLDALDQVPKLQDVSLCYVLCYILCAVFPSFDTLLLIPNCYIICFV